MTVVLHVGFGGKVLLENNSFASLLEPGVQSCVILISQASSEPNNLSGLLTVFK
jgi:hypothetical protein